MIEKIPTIGTYYKYGNHEKIIELGYFLKKPNEAIEDSILFPSPKKDKLAIPNGLIKSVKTYPKVKLYKSGSLPILDTNSGITIEYDNIQEIADIRKRLK